MKYAKSQLLKFRKRDKVWRNSTGTCEAHIETKKDLEARSYQHWLFLTTIKNKVIFNDYFYSASTSGHQREVRRLLKNKYKIDLVVYQRESLNNGVNLVPIYEKKFLAEIKLAKKGLREKTKKDLIETIKEQDKKLKEILKLKVCPDLKREEKKKMKLEIEDKDIGENENEK